jgi:hypothetical protein
MTTQELSDFGLPYEFITNEKVVLYFRNKDVASIPSFISGLKSLLDCIEEHEFALEKKLFSCQKTSPYHYSGDLSNILSQVLKFLIENSSEIAQEDFDNFKNILGVF